MLALFPSWAHLCPSPAQASLTDRPDAASPPKSLGGETKAPCVQQGGLEKVGVFWGRVSGLDTPSLCAVGWSPLT